MKILKHIVMWRFQDFAEGRTRTENAQWMKEHLEALVGRVPELLSAEVGINIKESDAAYDAVLTATFRSMRDLKLTRTIRCIWKSAIIAKGQDFAHRRRLLGGRLMN